MQRGWHCGRLHSCTRSVASIMASSAAVAGPVDRQALCLGLPGSCSVLVRGEAPIREKGASRRPADASRLAISAQSCVRAVSSLQQQHSVTMQGEGLLFCVDRILRGVWALARARLSCHPAPSRWPSPPALGAGRTPRPCAPRRRPAAVAGTHVRRAAHQHMHADAAGHRSSRGHHMMPKSPWSGGATAQVQTRQCYHHSRQQRGTARARRTWSADRPLVGMALCTTMRTAPARITFSLPLGISSPAQRGHSTAQHSIARSLAPASHCPVTGEALFTRVLTAKPSETSPARAGLTRAEQRDGHHVHARLDGHAEGALLEPSHDPAGSTRSHAHAAQEGSSMVPRTSVAAW